jgi:hypothetical protein
MSSHRRSLPGSGAANLARPGKGSAASAASTATADLTKQQELTVEQLRALAENPNFNLTSVLQNPRGAAQRSLYEELMDFDPFNPWGTSDPDSFQGAEFENELEPGKLPPPPVPLPPVTLDMFQDYTDRRARLHERFIKNHGSNSSSAAGVGGDGGGALATTTNEAAAQKGKDKAAAGGGEKSGSKGGGSNKSSVPTPKEVYAEVPALFQKAHFTLEEPAIFEQVVCHKKCWLNSFKRCTFPECARYVSVLWVCCARACVSSFFICKSWPPP